MARKALILARGLGWRLELSDVNVSLYPPAEKLTVDDFMAKLPSLDADFAKRATEVGAGRARATRPPSKMEN